MGLKVWFCGFILSFLMPGWFWTLDDILEWNQYIWNCEAVGLHSGDVFNHFLQILGDKMGTDEQQRRRAERREKVDRCMVSEERGDWWLHADVMVGGLCFSFPEAK